MFKKKYTLLRSQKKKVYEILQEAGLEPAEFSWSKEEIAGSIIVSKLSYRDGTWYFQFCSYELNAWSVASPGVYRSVDYEYPKNWEEQEGHFRNWAHCLKRERDTIDPWAELAKYKMVFALEGPEEMVNEPIAAVEAEQIGESLVRVCDRIVPELRLEGEQALLVRTRLGYLADAAGRQRSRDWAYTMLGICVSMAIALSLSEEMSVILWRLVESELGPFVRLVPAARHEAAPSPKPRILGIRAAAARSVPQEESSDTLS